MSLIRCRNVAIISEDQWGDDDLQRLLKERIHAAVPPAPSSDQTGGTDNWTEEEWAEWMEWERVKEEQEESDAGEEQPTATTKRATVSGAAISGLAVITQPIVRRGRLPPTKSHIGQGPRSPSVKKGDKIHGEATMSVVATMIIVVFSISFSAECESCNLTRIVWNMCNSITLL